METTKKCVACLESFTDDTPGMAGLFKNQAIAAGVCPNCQKGARCKASSTGVNAVASTLTQRNVPMTGGSIH